MGKLKALWKLINDAWNLYGMVSALGWATMTGALLGIWSYLSSLPPPAVALIALSSFTLVYVFVTSLRERAASNNAAVNGGRLAAMPSLFYEERDPNCHQPDGRVFRPIVGEGNVEYDETIYRLGVRSENQILRCRVVLADVEPKPHVPGQQRIGLAMRPRIPGSVGSYEFTVNRDAPAFIDVLQEVKQRVNPLNQASLIKLIYVNEDHGRANWFENGYYILTFRLEGPITPVKYRLVVKFDGRSQQRRWRVEPA